MLGNKRNRGGVSNVPNVLMNGTRVELLVDTTAEAVKTRFLQFLCGYGQQPQPSATIHATALADQQEDDGDRNGNPRDSEQDGLQQQQEQEAMLAVTSAPTVNYSQQAEVMRNTETSSLFVDFTHVLEYDPDLAHAIQAQYYRWEPYLRKSVFEFIRMEDAAYTINEDANKTQREFFVCFYNFQHVSRIRELRTRSIGELVSFSGTVTRTSEVRPELLFGAFRCGECGGDTTGVEQQFRYTEPVKCQNPYCSNTFDWELNAEKSVFVDWQRVKVQENSDEIPAGSMPRSIDVILRHENVEQAKAGDRVVFTGTMIVVPDVSKFARSGIGENAVATKGGGNNSRRGESDNSMQGMEGEGVRGLKALGVRELTYKTCFLACSVQTMEQRFNHISIRSETGEGEEDNAEADFSEEELDTIRAMRSDPLRYDKMAKSICPSVYGHDEIRKGILLMLFGGVHKTTQEGIKLRGDINVCIVGDPSTAKSQFLKYICNFLPRAIYASGKVSSAAGLTASVTRDAESGDYCVEAGALMLADNGICCIDEFDKMDPMDQVAIHEAMEQQTISITKAGIQAILNARTSILAAANPYNGRYDKTKTLKYNVNISAPIMSRFDLFFVILDDCDEATDLKIAEHIVNLHLPGNLQQEQNRSTFYSEEDLKRYIKFARSLNPVITEESKRMMVACYRNLRENDVVNNGQTNIAYRITVRQLESMIRLAEALARLDLSEVVEIHHVREAYRLLSKSILHVETKQVALELPVIQPQDPSQGSSSQQSQSIPTQDNNIHQSTSPEDPAQLTSSASTSQASTAKSKRSGEEVTLTFERFAAIQKAICRFIREKEDEQATRKLSKQTRDKIQADHDPSDPLASLSEEEDIEPGVLQGEIVTWYLSSQEISSEAQLLQEKHMINSVIEKLLKEKYLMVVEDDEQDPPDQQQPPEQPQQQQQQQQQQAEPSESEDKDAKKQQRYLTVHPNYAFE